MAEEEIWKVFPGYSFVEVSNLGRVRTKDHWVTYKNGIKRLYKGHVLKQKLSKSGYMYVYFKTNGKTVGLRVHRMVATCFIPNPHGYPVVNHLDNNRTNNAASNLEWCTKKENEAYKKNFGTSQAEVSGRPVIAIDLDSFEVLWFESQNKAARQIGVYSGSVCAVVKGKISKTGGWWFCNADSTAVEKTRSKFGDELAEKVEKLLREHM